MGQILDSENKLKNEDYETKLFTHMVRKMTFSKFRETIVAITKEYDKYSFFILTSKYLKNRCKSTLEDEYEIYDIQEDEDSETEEDGDEDTIKTKKKYRQSNILFYHTIEHNGKNFLIKLDNVTFNLITKDFFLDKKYTTLQNNSRSKTYVSCYPDPKFGKIKID